MKQIIDFPWIPFAQLPTPLYKLENLSREIGKNIYIKRDDMTGVALGGNKVRKLEFLLADARSKGAAKQWKLIRVQIFPKVAYEHTTFGCFDP